MGHNTTDDAIRILEVSPRDGLQGEDWLVPTDAKLTLINDLINAGLQNIEVTSFVPPRWMPQFSDASEVFTQARASAPAHVNLSALVPNIRGAQNALGEGVSNIAVIASATESFSLKNLNAPLATSWARVEQLITFVKQENPTTRVRAYLSMAWEDPWEGVTPTSHAAMLASRLFVAGADVVALSDTIGAATPRHTRELLKECVSRGIRPGDLAFHLHDRAGSALDSIEVGLEFGVREFDASIGGIGRCPYAKSSPGNLSTHDLVSFLTSRGYSSIPSHSLLPAHVGDHTSSISLSGLDVAMEHLLAYRAEAAHREINSTEAYPAASNFIPRSSHE